MHHLAGQVELPEVGLVDIGQALGEFQAAAQLVAGQVERKGQHPDHQPLLGLAGVAGEGQVVVAIHMAVHVGDLELGFVDGGFERHGRGLGWGQPGIIAAKPHGMMPPSAPEPSQP